MRSDDESANALVNAGYKLAGALRKCAVSRQRLANRLTRIAKGNTHNAVWMQLQAIEGLDELRESHPDLPMFMEVDSRDAGN